MVGLKTDSKSKRLDHQRSDSALPGDGRTRNTLHVQAGRSTSVHDLECGTIHHPATMESQAWHFSGEEQAARQLKDPIIWKQDANPRGLQRPSC